MEEECSRQREIEQKTSGRVMWWCLPSPSKIPVPRRGARLSMNLVVSANSTSAGACL